MRAITFGFTVAVALITASPVLATTINFDGLSTNTVVTNQYPELTFSSNAGEQILAVPVALGSSPPNIICTAAIGGSLDCARDVFVDFTGAVSGLSFLAVGDNNVGDIGDVRVFTGATLLGTVNIIGDGNGLLPNLVDLSGFTGVTRIEIANITDPFGLGYDDFTFTAADVAPGVPEPATWAMMLLGFGGIGLAVRRRRTSLLARA